MDRQEIVARYTNRHGKLVQLPAKYTIRLEVFAWLAEQFQPGVDYPEDQVNNILDGHAVDYAALRRYLVDAGLLTRAAGIYQRSGDAGT